MVVERQQMDTLQGNISTFYVDSQSVLIVNLVNKFFSARAILAEKFLPEAP